MESGDSGVTSPVLRVTAEISELKGDPSSRSNGKFSDPPSVASKDGKTNLFTKKKVLNPLYGHNPYLRNNAGSFISSCQNPKNNVSAFTQRVMSAKLLRTKQLQNQLAETQMKLNEVLYENKTLKTLQKRQDSVLRKYEGNQEQLPQLLKSHHEEIRVLNEKYKQLRVSYRELESRMKQKDHELTNLREQYKHLLKLSRDKHLGEREKLTSRVEEMEAIIEQQKTKIQNLEKKLQLEEKNHRFLLNQEINKLRKSQSELNSALETLSNLKATIEAKERFASASYPRYHQSAPTQAKSSHVSLPAPPRVSIRQSQRQANSESALQQEDSETADSLTINYSPGEPGSSSMDSDNSSVGKEENENIKRSHQSEGKNRLVGMVQGGIHISKAAFQERRATRRISAGKESKPTKAEENKLKAESINPKLSKESSNNENKNNNLNEKIKVFQNNEETKSKSLSCNEVPSVKPMQNTASDREPTVETKGVVLSELEMQEVKLFNEIEKEINSQESAFRNDMKLDMDDEFEKFLEGTKLSDEAISEYFKRDFRAEIYEIEKKFKDLDKASERYMNVNKRTNGASIHTPLAGESDSEEDDITHKDTNGEAEDVLGLLDSSKSQTRLNGPTLGESQKANLLKALSNIDETSKSSSHGRKDGEQENIPDKSDHTPSSPPVNNFTRTRRKSLVMKDLFGEEGTKL